MTQSEIELVYGTTVSIDLTDAVPITINEALKVFDTDAVDDTEKS